jgi:hypothetical protein
MRTDQYERLQAITEKLTDVFLSEADPDKWPGHGIDLAKMDQQTRGDLYWSKKNAAATLTVIMKTANLVGVIQQRSAGGGDGGAAVSEAEREADTLDADIRAAEKEATKLLNKMQKGANRKAHGKS